MRSRLRLTLEEEVELLRYVLRQLAKCRTSHCKYALRMWLVWCVRVSSSEGTIRKARLRRVFTALKDTATETGQGLWRDGRFYPSKVPVLSPRARPVSVLGCREVGSNTSPLKVSPLNRGAASPPEGDDDDGDGGGQGGEETAQSMSFSG